MTHNLKTLLKGLLTQKELAIMPTSFDVVGDILIFLDFPEELSKKERKIAERILQEFPNIKVVTKKVKQYSGRYRLPVLRIIGGARRKTTLHKENGIRLRLHVEDVYFSPRLSTERQRVMKQVKRDEDVLVLFSGCGPYVIAIAKNTPCREVVGIEINPKAHDFAKQNAELNKVQRKTKLYCGDADKTLPKLNRKFDRIIMPLPKSAADFLPAALKASKKGAIIHYYSFAEEGQFKEEERNVLAICERHEKKCRILKTTKCGQYSPGHFRICVDVLLG